LKRGTVDVPRHGVKPGAHEPTLFHGTPSFRMASALQFTVEAALENGDGSPADWNLLQTCRKATKKLPKSCRKAAGPLPDRYRTATGPLP